MSFCSEQKNEIISQMPKASCCKRAILQGVLAAKGLLDGTNITLSVDTRATADFVCELIHEIYSKTPEVGTSARGGRRLLISFSSPAAEKYIKALSSGGECHKSGCAACQSSLLRGLFLASGRVCNPEKQYLLELHVPYNREVILSYLNELGLSPKVSKKPHEVLIYFKKSTDIEDFFALAGMNNTAFAFMNAKINGELRNNVNRIINCTTSNIGKAVSASLQQIELIERLVEKGLISKLPDELEATARLRLEHRDLSLSQLAAIITPKISKPGLSHRLKRITELAKELLGIDDGE